MVRVRFSGSVIASLIRLAAELNAAKNKVRISVTHREGGLEKRVRSQQTHNGVIKFPLQPPLEL